MIELFIPAFRPFTEENTCEHKLLLFFFFFFFIYLFIYAFEVSLPSYKTVHVFSDCYFIITSAFLDTCFGFFAVHYQPMLLLIVTYFILQYLIWPFITYSFIFF